MMRNWLIVGMVCCICAALAGRAMADPIEVVFDPLDPKAVVDDGNGGNLDVTLIPGGDPITKIFQPSGGVAQAYVLYIVENWHVAEGPSIADWHESIVTAGLVWADVRISVPGSINGIGTSSVDIYFDPSLPFCTNFTIEKWIEVPAGWDGSAILVEEWPTPEPATMTLLGLGLAGLVARRRRRA